jgi:hypothetical protein
MSRTTTHASAALTITPSSPMSITVPLPTSRPFVTLRLPSITDAPSGVTGPPRKKQKARPVRHRLRTRAAGCRFQKIRQCSSRPLRKNVAAAGS